MLNAALLKKKANSNLHAFGKNRIASSFTNYSLQFNESILRKIKYSYLQFICFPLKIKCLHLQIGHRNRNANTEYVFFFWFWKRTWANILLHRISHNFLSEQPSMKDHKAWAVQSCCWKWQHMHQTRKKKTAFKTGINKNYININYSSEKKHYYYIKFCFHNRNILTLFVHIHMFLSQRLGMKDKVLDDTGLKMKQKGKWNFKVISKVITLLGK